MLRHILFFKIPENTKSGNLLLLKDKPDGLKNKTDGIQSFHTEVNTSRSRKTCDLILESEFHTEEDLEEYRIHLEHQKGVLRIKELNCETAVVDYIV